MILFYAAFGCLCKNPAGIDSVCVGVAVLTRINIGG